MHAPNVERSPGSILDTINAHSLESVRFGNRRKNRIVNYEMISGDSHIDLSWLPADLFTANALGRIPNESLRKI